MCKTCSVVALQIHPSICPSAHPASHPASPPCVPGAALCRICFCVEAMTPNLQESSYSSGSDEDSIFQVLTIPFHPPHSVSPQASLTRVIFYKYDHVTSSTPCTASSVTSEEPSGSLGWQAWFFKIQSAYLVNLFLPCLTFSSTLLPMCSLLGKAFPLPSFFPLSGNLLLILEDPALCSG